MIHWPVLKQTGLEGLATIERETMRRGRIACFEPIETFQCDSSIREGYDPQIEDSIRENQLRHQFCINYMTVKLQSCQVFT